MGMRIASAAPNAPDNSKLRRRGPLAAPFVLAQFKLTHYSRVMGQLSGHF